jgi:predicted histone-like DNA-binding protein
MSIRYKKQQNKITGAKSFGKWYGRAVSLGRITMENLAEEISHSTTVTQADILAVLNELSHYMKGHLQNSQTVVLDGIGAFQVGIKSSPVDKENDFTSNNIKSYHILYKPEVKFVANGIITAKGHRSGHFVKTLLDGITAEEFDKNKKKDSTTTTTQP